MLLAEAWEEEFLKVLPIIFLVFAYPDDAILDDVGHNYICFCLTFYSYSMDFMEMLHGKRRIFLISDDFCDIMSIFADIRKDNNNEIRDILR